MKSWKPRQGLLTNLVQTSAKQALSASPKDPPPMPDNVAAWLAQLKLLYGVPFEYLVPDYRMLPPESMRYFYLDPNWTGCLAEGALAVGSTSTRDVLTNYGLARGIQPALDKATALTRCLLREVDPPGSVPAGGTVAGFLLRSIAVSGWPGLEVRGYLNGELLPAPNLLRMDRLSPEVLFVLFAGIPDKVTVNEPPEGLHFGIRDLGTPPLPSTLLRGLGYGGYTAGAELDPPVTVTVPMRQGGQYPGVVDVTALAATLKSALGGLTPSALDPSGDFTSCELAIEMIRSAGLQEFDPETSLAAAPAGSKS